MGLLSPASFHWKRKHRDLLNENCFSFNLRVLLPLHQEMVDECTSVFDRIKLYTSPASPPLGTLCKVGDLTRLTGCPRPYHNPRMDHQSVQSPFRVSCIKSLTFEYLRHLIHSVPPKMRFKASIRNISTFTSKRSFAYSHLRPMTVLARVDRVPQLPWQRGLDLL